MSKHTPTPWRWEDPVELRDETFSRCLIADNGRPVLRHQAQTWGLSDANAAHIVLCVNSHEALVDFVTAVSKGRFAAAYPLPSGRGRIRRFTPIATRKG